MDHRQLAPTINSSATHIPYVKYMTPTGNNVHVRHPDGRTAGITLALALSTGCMQHGLAVCPTGTRARTATRQAGRRWRLTSSVHGARHTARCVSDDDVVVTDDRPVDGMEQEQLVAGLLDGCACTLVRPGRRVVVSLVSMRREKAGRKGYRYGGSSVGSCLVRRRSWGPRSPSTCSSHASSERETNKRKYSEL